MTLQARSSPDRVERTEGPDRSPRPERPERPERADGSLPTFDRVFKALADPTRVRILGLLLAGEVCVCHIHETLRIPQPKASRHLAYLRRAGLVQARKRGLWVYYRLAPRRADPVQTLLDAVHHCIGHVSALRRDAARLEKKTGSSPVQPPAPTFACCAGAPVDGPS
jgi:ArsR family transcriptional regulator